MNILQETIKDLHQLTDLNKYSIKQLFFRSDFSVVGLNDGSVGSSLNYDKANCLESRYDAKEIESKLHSLVTTDPLLLNFLLTKENLWAQSLLTSVVSALSQKFITNEYLRPRAMESVKIAGYPAINEILASQITQDVKVAIIGFPGLTKFFLSQPKVKELFLLDYNFSSQRGKFHQLALVNYKQLLQSKTNQAQITLSDGQGSENFIKQCDWLIISGSTLCNGTLAEILKIAEGKYIILQGPSCSIWPGQLFKLGVNDIFTTIKSKLELKLARFNSSLINRYVDHDYVHLYPIKQL